MVIHTCNLSIQEAVAGGFGAILEIIEILFQKEKFLTHCSIVDSVLPQIHDTTTPCGHTFGGQWPLYKHHPIQSVPHSVMQELLPVYR